MEQLLCMKTSAYWSQLGKIKLALNCSIDSDNCVLNVEGYFHWLDVINIKRKRKCFYFSKLKHVYFNVIWYDEHTEISIKLHCLHVQSKWFKTSGPAFLIGAWDPRFSFKTFAPKRIGSTSIYPAISTCDVNRVFCKRRGGRATTRLKLRPFSLKPNALTT